jgi:hypothetical protein
MRDGVELNVRITRPNTPGKFPAILEYNPYRRLRAPPAGSRDGYPLVVPYLVERGYVVVQYDVRGTGRACARATRASRGAPRTCAAGQVEAFARAPSPSDALRTPSP